LFLSVQFIKAWRLSLHNIEQYPTLSILFLISDKLIEKVSGKNRHKLKAETFIIFIHTKERDVAEYDQGSRKKAKGTIFGQGAAFKDCIE
jgi:hypothetical protein